MAKFRTLHSYIADRETTLQEDLYASMKDAAHRNGKRFDLTFEEWLPIWTKLDEAAKACVNHCDRVDFIANFAEGGTDLFVIKVGDNEDD